MKNSDYRIETANKGTRFIVVSDYHRYGSLYKTRKGAEKELARVRKAAGEIFVS